MNVGNTTAATGMKRRWVILAIAYLCILAFAITMQSVPPVLSLIMAEFQLSHAQGGLLMTLFALPGIIISIPAGILADRYGQKAIGVICFALMIAGTAIFASGSSLPMLGLGRVVSGVGATTLLVLAPQLLAQWFAGNKLGIVMGIFNTGMPLGTILSLNFLSLAGENLGWRASTWLSAVVPLIALVMFVFLFAPAPSTGQRIPPKKESFLRSIRLTGISIWIVGIAWMLFNAALISMFTFTPDFLQVSGFSISSAGFITSAAMWPGAVLTPLVGYMIVMIDRKRAMISIGALALTILIVIVPASTNWILALMLLLGVVSTLVPAPIYALSPEVTSPERLGLGYGILATCLNLGVVAGPAAVGIVKDVTGSYGAGYALMAGLAFLIIPAMIILSLRQKRM